MAPNVRFSAVMAACGTPEVYLPLSDPKHDKTFQRAVREQRVMTISQQNVGTKKDFGTVGFIEGKLVTYLLFPKSLRAFEGKRVIGISYETLRSAEVASPKAPPRIARKQRVLTKPQRRIPPAPPPPKPKQFKATVRVTATADVNITVRAFNKSEARAKAEKEATQHVDFATAAKQTQVKTLRDARNEELHSK